MSVSNPVVIQYVTNITQIGGPTWWFQGTEGDCEAGKFVTNNANSLLTTSINISGFNSAGSNSAYLMGIGVGNYITFTDSIGRTASFTIGNMTPDEDGCMNIVLATPAGDLNWDGLYNVSFNPGT